MNYLFHGFSSPQIDQSVIWLIMSLVCRQIIQMSSSRLFCHCAPAGWNLLPRTVLKSPWLIIRKYRHKTDFSLAYCSDIHGLFCYCLWLWTVVTVIIVIITSCQCMLPHRMYGWGFYANLVTCSSHDLRTWVKHEKHYCLWQVSQTCRVWKCLKLVPRWASVSHTCRVRKFHEWAPHRASLSQMCRI